jgi:NTP pyrophosphatase (non-canonical NTP hydrolase)
MTLDELNAFIEERDGIYNAMVSGEISARERVLVRLAKLTEEVGELSEEILSSFGHQRKEKLDKHEPENIGKEAADVIITTLLLAKSLDIDMTEALRKKIAIVRERYGTASAGYKF